MCDYGNYSSGISEIGYCDQHDFLGPDRSHFRRDLITGNAERERSRVKTLRGAFLELQRTLPAVPPDTKLSKLDVLVLATTYIAHLMRTLNDEDDNQVYTTNGILHPVKKWPMRSRLYAGILSSTFPIYTQGYSQTRRVADQNVDGQKLCIKSFRLHNTM